MRDNAEKVKVFSCRPLDMDVQVLVDQQKLTYNRSVQTQDVV